MIRSYLYFHEPLALVYTYTTLNVDVYTQYAVVVSLVRYAIRHVAIVHSRVTFHKYRMQDTILHREQA